MFGLGAGELFIIFVFALIFIGPKKLPELAKGLGKGIREFQKAKSEIMDDVHSTSSPNKAADTKPANEEVNANAMNSEKAETSKSDESHS